MCVYDYNTLFLCHHSNCADDGEKKVEITSESTGDFSGDFSDDWQQYSDFRFRYTESSLTVLPMLCRTRLLEYFRLLEVRDVALVSSRVSSQLTQQSSRILLQVSDDNGFSISFDTYSILFFGCFFLDIIICPYKLLFLYRHQLSPSISTACVRVGDEHQERQLFFARFCIFDILLFCNLFFYTCSRLVEVSDRDNHNVRLVPVESVHTRMPDIHLISTMTTCSHARVCVGLGNGIDDSLRLVCVTGDGEFLEAGIQQLANVWSWDRTSVRKFVGSLCELGAASIETKANRTCIRLTNIEGSDPTGHLTRLSLSPSDFLSKRFNLSRWPTATPRLCRGSRCRFTALYGSVPRRSLMALARQNAMHSLSLIRTFRNFLQIQKCRDPYLRAASWGHLLGQGKPPGPLISSLRRTKMNK